MWGAPLPRTLLDEVLPIKEDGTGELLKVVEYYEKSLKPPLEENGDVNGEGPCNANTI